jgi:glutamate-ammonia-ligase adenylyltransferase
MKAPVRRKAKANNHRTPLASRICEAPRIANAKAAKHAVAELIASAPENLRAQLSSVVESSEFLARLLQGLFEDSPYLWGTIGADPAMLVRLVEEAPEAALDRVLAIGEKETLAASDDVAAQKALRRMKREAALLIALCDIGGVWRLDEVTSALTRLADAAVRAAVARALGAANAAGKMNLADPSAPGQGSGYVVLAMGKYGASELNYSSDIDLIVFYERKAPLSAGIESAPFFVGLTKSLLRLVNDRTEDGYVFRVDLRLRPDPGSTQIAISTDAALEYYEREGQTWERAAFKIFRLSSGAGTSTMPRLPTCTQ